MAYESSQTSISLNDQVRFKEERLAVLAPADRKRLEGRVGVVQGYWNHTRKLTVSFPEDGGRSELRIMSVDPRQLERVLTAPVEPEAAPEAESSASPDLAADEPMSQEDTDNLFG
jgi:hypothetical protein